MEIYDRVLTNIDYAEKSPLMKSIDKLHSRTVYSFLKGRKITREDGEVKTTMYPFRKLSVFITLIALPILLVTVLIKALNKKEKRIYRELTEASKKENPLGEGKVKENNPKVNPLNLSGVKKDSNNEEERDSEEETPLVRRRTPRKDEGSKEGDNTAGPMKDNNITLGSSLEQEMKHLLNEDGFAQPTAMQKISSSDLMAFPFSENSHAVPFFSEEDLSGRTGSNSSLDGSFFIVSNNSTPTASPAGSLYPQQN